MTATKPPLCDDFGLPETFADQDRRFREMRASIDRDGDFVVNMGDGRGRRNASKLLDEIDAEATELAELEQMIDGWKGKP